MKKIIFISLLLLINILSFSQVYSSYITYSPSYESIIEEKTTVIEFNEFDNQIRIYNATYEGEITNLHIDTIVTKNWSIEPEAIKTYYCVDTDDNSRVLILDMIEKRNLIKIIYIWDEITVEEYTILVKNKF